MARVQQQHQHGQNNGGTRSDNEKKQTSRRGACKYRPCSFHDKNLHVWLCTKLITALWILFKPGRGRHEDTRFFLLFFFFCALPSWIYNSRLPSRTWASNITARVCHLSCLSVHTRNAQILRSEMGSRVSHSTLVSTSQTLKGTKHVCTLHETTGKGNPQFAVYKYKASTARRNSKNVSRTERTDPGRPNFVSVFSTNSSSNHCVD